MTDSIETAMRAPAPEAAEAARRFALRAAADGAADVSYTTVDSPLGELLLAASPRGLVRLAYVYDGVDSILDDLARRVSPRIVEAPAFLDAIAGELGEYFAGRRREFDAPVDWSVLGGFGRKVLEATAAIPFGEVSSYGEIAAEVCSPRAARATGNALGANPMAIVIPCHRILRAGGALGGYTGGLDKKRYLLALEGHGELAA